MAKRGGLIFDKQKKLTKLEIKLVKEKQFNRKVKINAQIHIIKQEIEKLL